MICKVLAVILSISVVKSLAANTAEQEELLKKCERGCGFDWDPVCGTDSVNYDNRCLFENGRCKAKVLGTALEVAHEGRCSEEPVMHLLRAETRETTVGENNNEMSPCHKQKFLATRMHLVGNLVPQCEATGLFKVMQCKGSTGFCHCVNQKTGEKVEETAATRGAAGLNCDHLKLPECWDCPGCPMPMCSDVPCEVNKCDKHPLAECVNNFCGGCNAHYYVQGIKVAC